MHGPDHLSLVIHPAMWSPAGLSKAAWPIPMPVAARLMVPPAQLTSKGACRQSAMLTCILVADPSEGSAAWGRPAVGAPGPQPVPLVVGAALGVASQPHPCREARAA